MDWHDLEKMKADALRELGKEKTDLEGLSGMKKDQLVEELAAKLGIEKPHKRIEAGLGKRKIKAEIKALKQHRDEAIQAKNADELRRVRQRMHGLKRKLRRMAHLAG